MKSANGYCFLTCVSPDFRYVGTVSAGTVLNDTLKTVTGSILDFSAISHHRFTQRGSTADLPQSFFPRNVPLLSPHDV